MKLTGLCGKDFEKWYFDKEYRKDYLFFNRLPTSMKYGVLVDFAEKYKKEHNQVNHILKIFRILFFEMGLELEKARTDSVLKFNVIYNNNGKLEAD